jgi:hypothetical protein
MYGKGTGLEENRADKNCFAKGKVWCKMTIGRVASYDQTCEVDEETCSELITISCPRDGQC